MEKLNVYKRWWASKLIFLMLFTTSNYILGQDGKIRYRCNDCVNNNQWKELSGEKLSYTMKKLSGNNLKNKGLYPVDYVVTVTSDPGPSGHRGVNCGCSLLRASCESTKETTVRGPIYEIFMDKDTGCSGVNGSWSNFFLTGVTSKSGATYCNPDTREKKLSEELVYRGSLTNPKSGFKMKIESITPAQNQNETVNIGDFHELIVKNGKGAEVLRKYCKNKFEVESIERHPGFAECSANCLRWRTNLADNSWKRACIPYDGAGVNPRVVQRVDQSTGKRVFDIILTNRSGHFEKVASGLTRFPELQIGYINGNNPQTQCVGWTQMPSAVFTDEEGARLAAGGCVFVEPGPGATSGGSIECTRCAPGQQQILKTFVENGLTLTTSLSGGVLAGAKPLAANQAAQQGFNIANALGFGTAAKLVLSSVPSSEEAAKALCPETTFPVNLSASFTGFEEEVKPPSAKNNFISVYPNPTTSRVNLEMDASPGEEIMVEIYDLTGRNTVNAKYSVKGDSLREEVDISTLPRGIYIMNIRTSMGREFAGRKIVKE